MDLDKEKVLKNVEKIVLSPKTCDASRVSSMLADEKPQQNSDLKIVLELRLEDLTGWIPWTSDPTNRGPVPGYSSVGTSIEDLVRPTELINSFVLRMCESVIVVTGKVRGQ